MQKNVASQKVQFFAFDITTGAAKTGDSANITGYVDIDSAGVNVLGDTSATEIQSTNAPGWYQFDLTQGETNGNDLLFTGKSSTGNVSVVGFRVQTTPAGFMAATFPGTVASTTNITAGTITTVTTVTAVTGLTASDVGAIKTKTDFLPSATAGAAGGVFIAGSNAATTVNITGNLTGNVTGSVGSVTGLTASNLDTTISSRMATYVQPTGFLAATFPGTVASTTNITAGTITTVTNLTNAATSGDFTATMKTSIGTAVAASAVASVTGNIGGNVNGNVVGSVGSVTAGVTVTTNNDKTGYRLDATGNAAVATAVLTAADLAPIASNIKEVNDVAIQGAGVLGNSWRPV